MKYNQKAHRHDTVHGLMQHFLGSLEAIIQVTESDGSLHFTPSDFDLVELDDDDLRNLLE
jgi:hypothetical protein